MNKKVLWLIVFLIQTFGFIFAQNKIKLSDDLVISKLSDTVYVVTHYFPWESNSLILKASDNEIVLIDTPYNVKATSLMMNWINNNLKPNKITAINTGFHIDNLGGNQLLRELNIDIYGADRTCTLVDERGQQTQQQLISWLTPEQEQIKRVFESMTFVKPNKIYKIEEGLLLNIGNLSIEVYFPGESHSPDNVVVYIKELKLLFGGCMVKSLSSNNLGFTGDANLSEWPKSLKKVQEKFPFATLVIPHHGRWGNNELIEHTIQLATPN